MKLSDTTTNMGAVQFCEKYCQFDKNGILNDTDNLQEFLGYINLANSNVWHYIFYDALGWKFDDSNYDTLPHLYVDITTGTTKYTLPESVLVLDRVEFNDGNGNIRKLKHYDENLANGSLREGFTQNGTPEYYRITDRVIEILPASDKDVSGGLEIYFGRDFLQYTSSDLTKSLGFASPYHSIIPKLASLEWLKINRPTSNQISILSSDVEELKQNIITHYSNRLEDDTGQRLTVKRISWR